MKKLIFSLILIAFLIGCNTNIVETGTIRVSVALPEEWQASGSTPVTRGITGGADGVINRGFLNQKIILKDGSLEKVLYDGNITSDFSPGHSPPHHHQEALELTGINAGENITIEVRLMNKESTYVGRAEVTIEPYETTDVSIEISEAVPHIVMPFEPSTSTSGTHTTLPETYELYFYSDLDTSVKKASGSSEQLKFELNGRTWDFDKYGRLFYFESSGKIKAKFTDGLYKNVGSNVKAFCIDRGDNIIYALKEAGGNTKVLKYQIKYDSSSHAIGGSTEVGDPISGEPVGIAVGADYLAVITTEKICTLQKTGNLIVQKELTNNLYKSADLAIVGDKIYVLYTELGVGTELKKLEDLTSSAEKKRIRSIGGIKIYNKNDLLFVTEANGFSKNVEKYDFDPKPPNESPTFFGPVKFLGQRGNLLYIADYGAFRKGWKSLSEKGWAEPVSRVAILNTQTNDVEFVEAPKVNRGGSELLMKFFYAYEN